MVEGPWDRRLFQQYKAGRNPASLQTDSQKRGGGHARGKYYRSGQKRGQCHNLQPSRSPVLYLWGALGTGSAVTIPPRNTGLQLPPTQWPSAWLGEVQLGVPAPPPQAGWLRRPAQSPSDPGQTPTTHQGQGNHSPAERRVPPPWAVGSPRKSGAAPAARGASPSPASKFTDSR